MAAQSGCPDKIVNDASRPSERSGTRLDARTRAYRANGRRPAMRAQQEARQLGISSRRRRPRSCQPWDASAIGLAKAAALSRFG